MESLLPSTLKNSWNFYSRNFTLPEDLRIILVIRIHENKDGITNQENYARKFLEMAEFLLQLDMKKVMKEKRSQTRHLILGWRTL